MSTIENARPQQSESVNFNDRDRELDAIDPEVEAERYALSLLNFDWGGE